MSRKILSLILCAVILLGLCSCAGNKDTNEPGSNTYNPDSSQTSDATGESEEATDGAVKLTVPEGYTLLRIAWLLEEKEICSTDDFLKAVEDYDLSKRPLLEALSKKENICFKLEGYLFPATYSFKKGEDPVNVIDKMLDAFESRMDADTIIRAGDLGFTIHEILTIASIIEKEAKTDEQRALISSTIHNRLKKGMRLEYDVTVKYCTQVIEVQYPDKIDHYKYFYNGNRVDGIIEGPICNPGMSSIHAALYPEETDYLFFVIDTEPPYHDAFAVTYEEHLKNVEKWKNGEL